MDSSGGSSAVLALRTSTRRVRGRWTHQAGAQKGPEVSRTHDAAARVFPSPPLRALLYLLACGAVVVPFLAIWKDRRGRAVGPAVALGLFFVVHASSAQASHCRVARSGRAQVLTHGDNAVDFSGQALLING